MTDFLAIIAETDLTDRPALLSIGRAMSEDPAMCAVALASNDHRQAAMQALSVWRYELAAETPQKTWKDADRKHPSIARSLRIDPSDPASFYALFPFRLAKIDDQYRILAAYPPPAITGNDCHLDIEIVLAWNPKDNSVVILGDVQPQAIIPRALSDQLTVYGDPFQFFHAWVQQRAIWHMRRLESVAGKWSHPIEEYPGDIPGALIVGDIRNVRWPVQTLPPVINCIGCERGAVTGSIFRSANIPDVVDANMRAVA